MRKSIDELLKKPKMSVIKTINDLDVLIVEVSTIHLIRSEERRNSVLDLKTDC
jgi:hypothetical protein